MSRRGFVLYQPIIFLIFICMGVFRVQAAPISSQDASSVETKHVKLAVFEQPTGGEPLWEESHIAVPDEQGLYRVFMGAKHSQGVPVQFATGSEARWVGVQVEGEEEQPRILLASLKPVAMGTVKSSREGSSGPVLYQIMFRNNARPGFLPKISPTFSLTNSLITDDGSSLHIGGLSIASDGTITFLPTQPFPTSGVQTVTAGNSFIAIGGTTANPTVSLSTTATDARYLQPSAADARYLQLTGGTLTGLLIANGGVAGTTGNFSGALTASGGESLPATGTATAGGGFNSNTLDLSASAFNATSAVNQTFRWVAKPVNNNTINASGMLNLQFGSGGAPGDTGLSIASNGQITFAPGQIFPGFVNSVTAGNGIVVSGPATNPVISLNTSSNVPGTLSMDFFRGDGRFLTNVNAITANFAANAGSLNGLSGSTFARNDVPNDIVSGSIPPGHSGALNGLQIVNNGNLTLNNGNLSVAGNGNLTGNVTVGAGPIPSC